MKTFIITLSQNKDSLRSTQQAIQSAKDVGYSEPIEIFDAVLPTQWRDILPNANDSFNRYGRPDNVGACFASHYLLWKKCIELGEPILILEHDAIFVDNLPDIEFDKCVNFGRPSYIRPYEMIYEEPKEGLNPLVQVNFLGHHAYAIKPSAASEFVSDAEHRELTANDVWIDKVTYPWLEEYRPYPIIADTNFSTVQTDLPEDLPLIQEYLKVTDKDSPNRAYIEKWFPQVLEKQSNKHIKATDNELPKEYVEVYPGYWEKDIYAWIRKPIVNNKYLLVSWRMSGSEFCKEVIRENFPETTSLDYWAKSHVVLDGIVENSLLTLADTKVFVIITDPREVAMNLFYFDNGIHFHDNDYKCNRHPGLSFLNEVADKQLELIEYYKKTFGKRCIVLRYEDAFYYQDNFLNKVSNFINSEPLNIDDVRKYKRSIYKNVGDFNQFFPEEDLTEHYKQYKDFYDEWEYPEKGDQLHKYSWADSTSGDKVKYKDLLNRNGITLINKCCFTIADKDLSNRIKGLDEF